MSTALEKLLAEAEKKACIEIVKKFIKDSTLSNEKIAQIVDLSLEEINKITEEL